MLDDKYFGECKAGKERDFVCVCVRLLKLQFIKDLKEVREQAMGIFVSKMILGCQVCEVRRYWHV